MKKKSKSQRIAEGILKSVCSTMKAKAHAFIPVLNIMKFEPATDAYKEYTICTDGEIIYFNAKKIIDYAKQKRLMWVEQTLFHIIFHGLLGHFDETYWKDKELSWAVQDIQVYRCMRMLYEECELFVYPEDWKEILENHIGDELYFKGLKNKSFREQVIGAGEDVAYDDHITWDPPEGKGVKCKDGEESECGKKSLWKMAEQTLFGSEKKGKGHKEALMKAMLESKKEKNNQHGTEAGDFENEVSLIEGSSSYKELLERITSLSERVLEEQELDKVLYQYGLELYGDVPLVEPEEITEKQCLNTVVIAVDTSGSCTYRAERFFRELVAVFHAIREVGRIKHICYLECDTCIQQQEDCYSIEDFIEFGKSHTFRGGGGTEFTPVFQHTDELLEQGEQVDALIYITDGYGDFPEYDQKPPYDVYLLLDIDKDEDVDYVKQSWIPDWAECILLND